MSTVISKRPQTPTFQALSLSLNNRATFFLVFNWPCSAEGNRRRWFPLAEVKEIANSGGKIRKQWWSILSSTLTISMVPVRHYNHSWHLFLSSHRLRLETWVHLQFPQFLLHCATGHKPFRTETSSLPICNGFCMSLLYSCSRFTKSKALEASSLQRFSVKANFLSYISV